jgi:hypothetical protein
MREPGRSKPIDVEIVDEKPVPDRPDLLSTEAEATAKTFFHPMSGMAIIGIDLIAFGADAPTGMIFTPLISLLAFLVTFYAVYQIQRSKHGDVSRMAALKALIGAIAAGVPFPITGTMVGAGILLLSGLPVAGGKGK